MRKTIIALLLTLLVISPSTPLFAAESNSTAVLEAQLRAVKAYIARLIEAPTYKTLSHVEMRGVINDGTNWLLTAQEENGHFAYEYVPYDGKYLNDDNIVRQGGALFSLGEVYRRQVKKDAKIEKGIEMAIEFFEGMSIEGKEKGKTFRCVANTEKSSTCKLGSTALVVTGILGYVEGKPAVQKKYKKLIDDYTDYILLSQKDEGGFRHEYRLTKGFGEEESPFSNGEALLALVRAYQNDPSTELKSAIDSSFNYLKGKEYDNSLYLWIMAALKDMQLLWPNPEYVTYTRSFTEWRVARAPSKSTDHNYCAYAEGLASAFSVLNTKPMGGELVPLRNELDRLNSKHRTLQIKDTELYRVVRNSDGTFKLAKLSEPTRAKGGFLTGASVPTQRIDFTQHCVSTYVQTLVEIDGQSL